MHCAGNNGTRESYADEKAAEDGSGDEEAHGTHGRAPHTNARTDGKETMSRRRRSCAQTTDCG